MLKLTDSEEATKSQDPHQNELLGIYQALGLNHPRLEVAIRNGSESDQMLAIWNECGDADKQNIMKALNKLSARSYVN